MDIRSYFRSASKSSVVSSSSDSEDGNESEIDVQPNPPKKHCSSSTSKPSSKLGSGIWRYNKMWAETFPWLEFDEIYRVLSSNYVKRVEELEEGNSKMKSHSKCEVHLLSCQLDVETDRARKEGSIISQLQNVGEQNVARRLKL